MKILRSVPLLSIAMLPGSMLFAADLVPSAAQGVYTSFDLPSLCGGPFNPVRFTEPISINFHGAIVGNSNGGAECNPSGFVRDAKDGTISTFLAPLDFAPGLFTTVSAINARGQITGDVGYASGGQGPYLRDTDGSFTLIDIASETSGAADINRAGVIVGNYLTGASGSIVSQGFLRTPDGNITTFAAPGIPAPSGVLPIPVSCNYVFGNPSGGTCPVAINDLGKVAGYYIAAGPIVHGFAREAGGTITLFDVPSATATVPAAMNFFGAITGTWTDAAGVHGFMRDLFNLIFPFDVPGASRGTTNPVSINVGGVIVGTYSDVNGIHGFRRTPYARFTTLDFPDAPTGANCGGFTCGTYPTDVNDGGEITGHYVDQFGLHGFLFQP
jgi:hypothetical protein